MARVKNITDDPLDIPSLGVFAVQPGETVEVPDDFATGELWRVDKSKSKNSDEGDAQ